MIRSLSTVVLILAGLMVLGSGTAVAMPAAASYEEDYACIEIGETGGGSSDALPERVVIDHIGWWWHTFTFTGTVETEGNAGPPLASVDLSAGASPDGEPGSAIARCHGNAKITYEVELLPHVGVAESRMVPLKVRSRGVASASASSWGGKGVATLVFSVKRSDGTPLLPTAYPRACVGVAFQACPDDWPSATLFTTEGLEIEPLLVDISGGASNIVEIVISAHVSVYATAEAWAEWQGGEDRGGNATATAWIDPVIYIDPTWEHADDYDLVFSDGIAVPLDEDEDGTPDDADNCPELPNLYQEDADNDGVGDYCDNCPNAPNGPDGGTCTAGDELLRGDDCSLADHCGVAGFCSLDQEDIDTDEQGDACDPVFVPEPPRALGFSISLLTLQSLRRRRSGHAEVTS